MDQTASSLPLFPKLKNGIGSAPTGFAVERADTESSGRMLASWPQLALSPLASLRRFPCFDLPSCQWHLSSSSAFSSLCSPTFPKKVLSFRPCSLQDFLLQDDVTAFPLLWENHFSQDKTTMGSQEGHLELPCVEPAPQRDRPSWSTFELKERFYSSRHLSHITRRKLKGSHLNSRSITLYIFSFTVTLEQWAIPRKGFHGHFKRNALQLIKKLTQT